VSDLIKAANGMQEDADRSSAAPGPRPALTSTTLEAMRDVIREFFASVPTGKCSNCGAFSPSIKKQGHTKLFKARREK